MYAHTGTDFIGLLYAWDGNIYYTRWIHVDQT